MTFSFLYEIQSTQKRSKMKKRISEIAESPVRGKIRTDASVVFFGETGRLKSRPHYASEK